MVATALDVLSLDEARHQCRVDEVSAALDLLVTSAITNAVSYVSRRTGIPLVDVSKIFNVVPATNTYLDIPVADVKEIESISYWQPGTGELRLAADGAIDVATLGRIEDLRNGCTRIWSPAGGWPTRLEGSCYVVQAKIGFDIGIESESLRQAVILMTRVFFENPDFFESDFAVNALIEPWIRYNG